MMIFSIMSSKYFRQLFMNQLVDKIYILYITQNEINKFQKQMAANNLDIKYEFYLGTNGSAFKPYIQYFIKKRKNELKDNPIFRKINEIIDHKKYFIRNEKQLGHIRSFINIIRNAQKNNYKKICILESDALFHKDFQSLLQNYKETISTYPLFYLGSNDSRVKITNSFSEKLDIPEKKKQFTNLILKNYQLYQEKKVYQPHLPYGTFAMIIDQSLFQSVLDTLLLQIFPTDVLFFYIQHQLNESNINWGTAYPNLIIADVSKSSILEDRDPVKFAKSRGWILENYFICL